MDSLQKKVHASSRFHGLTWDEDIQGAHSARSIVLALVAWLWQRAATAPQVRHCRWCVRHVSMLGM